VKGPSAEKGAKMPEANINLPEGMSQADFEKAFQSFLKQRQNTQVRDKAVRSATKDLIASHKDEYDKLVTKYMPKE